MPTPSRYPALAAVLPVLGALVLLFVVIDAVQGDGVAWAGAAGGLFMIAFGLYLRRQKP